MADFEHVEMDTPSDYAKVIFRNISETYPLETDVEVLYTVTRYHLPSKRDWVGLYKVGWASSKDHLYYHWAIIPSNFQTGTEFEAKVTFAANVLPKDDGEFYQFCYVTSSGDVRGASTPFQFKHPASQHFVEVEDEDNDIMIIQSRTSALETELDSAKNAREELIKEKERIEKDMESYLSKLVEVEKELKSEREQKEAFRTDLETTQDKVASLHSEVKNKTVQYEMLNAKYLKAAEEKSELDDQLILARVNCEKLEDQIKELQNELDCLNGKVRSLEQEKGLYKEHVTSTEDALKENTRQLEALKCQHVNDTDEITSLREAARQLQAELQDKRQRAERQTCSTESDKKVIGDLRTQLQAVNEQLDALTEFKRDLGEQIDTYMQLNKKLSADLESSTAEVHDLKQRVQLGEQLLRETELQRDCARDKFQEHIEQLNALVKKKTEENKVLKSETDRLTEKTDRLSTELGSHQGNMEASQYALNMAQQELKKRLSKNEHEKRALEKDIGELVKRKVTWEEQERDLKKEIGDLKSRLLMGQEEYKDKYIECKKLQAIVRKTNRGVRRESSTNSIDTATKMTETARKSEAEQTTQTSSANNTQTTQTAVKTDKAAVTQTSVVEKSDQGLMTGDENTIELTNHEVQSQLMELGLELEKRSAKKEKYKQLYSDEREQKRYMQKHYHEQLEARDVTIRGLRMRVRVLEEEHEQYVRRMEQSGALVLKHSLEGAAAAATTGSPLPAPRTTLGSAMAPRVPASATPMYGRTQGEIEMINKVESLAMQRAAGTKEKTPEVADKKAEAERQLEKEALDEAIRVFDPLNRITEDGIEPKPTGTQGAAIEPMRVDFETPVITRPPSTKVSSIKTAARRLETASGSVNGYGESEYAPDTKVSQIHTSARRLATANGSVNGYGETVYEPDTIVSQTRTSTRDMATPHASEYDTALNEAPAAENIDRQADPEDERFYDAPSADNASFFSPKCPVCDLVFPTNVPAEVINVHAETHFDSMIDYVQVPLPLSPSAPLPSRPGMRKCIMCDEYFPVGDENQEAYEEHVRSHFT